MVHVATQVAVVSELVHESRDELRCERYYETLQFKYHVEIVLPMVVEVVLVLVYKVAT